MIHTMDCIARVNAQDPDYPTYKAMDCIAHCNANDDGIYGRIMDCEATIINVLVTACQSWNQGIRLVVTIDDIDVSAALTGSLRIQHDKNMISTFSLNLNNTAYSPRTNANIGIDKVVVITAYINRQEKKIFTGTTDEPEAENTPAFRVVVTGRDYGKMLLDKITTVISVQDLADTTKRNDLIKYLAGLAGQTNIDIPEMAAVTIDNSFQDQSVWDMIQKEAMVEQYWVGHNEDGKLELKLDEIKSDTALYPTPDWTYAEDKIFRLGYKKGRVNINKIIVLGKTTSKRIPTTTSYGDVFNLSKSWAEDEATIWNESSGNFSILYTQTEDATSYERGYIKITYTGEYTLSIISLSSSGQLNIYTKKYPTEFNITRYKNGGVLQAGGVNISFRGSEHSTTYETRYDQISAEVTDPNSIAKFGERDGGSVEYPLLETVEQCTAVGSKIIRDDHRKLGQADFLIPLNLLAKIGQTILVTDKKIGLNERYYVEKLTHNIDINEGMIKARTQVGGVLYV